MQEAQDDYLSIEEAANLLNRHTGSVWRLIRRYNLPTFRRPMDRKAYVRKSDIEKLEGTFERKVS